MLLSERAAAANVFFFAGACASALLDGTGRFATTFGGDSSKSTREPLRCNCPCSLPNGAVQAVEGARVAAMADVGVAVGEKVVAAAEMATAE